MPTQVQFRRGTRTQNNSFTGASGELTINTEQKSVRVHDGSTAGGFELARADMSNVGIGTSLTISTLNATSVNSSGLTTSSSLSVFGDAQITGVTTVGIFTATNVTANGTINVSGVSTLSNVSLNNGNITVSSNSVVTSSSGIITYYGDTSNTISGRWTVTASAPNNFLLSGIGLTQTTEDPILYLLRGQTYEFINNCGTGEGLFIKTSAAAGAGNSYHNGVIGNGSTVGIVTFSVPFNAPNTLYYQSNVNTAMGSTIVVVPNLI